jgi:hypothetical protein
MQYFLVVSMCSSISKVSDYGLDDRGLIPGRGKGFFPLASVFRPALRPAQPPVQWVPGVLSPGVKRGRGVKLTTQPHLVPRSRMSRSYTSSPPSASMACSGTSLPFSYFLICIRYQVTQPIPGCINPESHKQATKPNKLSWNFLTS